MWKSKTFHLYFETQLLLQNDWDMMGYLWHEGFGNQVRLFCFFRLVQVLVGSSNIHVSADVICRNIIREVRKATENKTHLRSEIRLG